MIQVSTKFLLSVIGVLGGLIPLLGIHLIIQRTAEVHRLRKKTAYIESRRGVWYQYLMGEGPGAVGRVPRILIPRRKSEREAVEEILLAYVRNVTMPPDIDVIRRFANTYMRDHYLKQLKSRRWSARVNALCRMIDFRLDSLLDSCKELERKKLSDEEWFQLLRIYGLFDPACFLVKVFSQDFRLSEYEYKKLFANISDDLFKIVMERMDELPFEGQFALLDLIGVKRSWDLIPFLHAKLKHEHVEIRLRALKAIHEIGIVEAPEQIEPFVTSPIWEERLMAAQILGKLPLERVFHHLKTLLHDESWWVRSKAATAIGGSREGRKKLEEIVATSDDRYAVDMASEVLMRGL